MSDAITLPAFATAHSHAFQRALRGRTQKRSNDATFWSWRNLMYALAHELDPDSIFALSRFAFAELALSGIAAVGEFHYVHHAPDGGPYADRIAMSDAVIRAAREVGLRITLLRVVYERAGVGMELEPAQRRFVDHDPEDALRDVESIAKRFAHDPHVTVGLAPHSVRAVTKTTLAEVAAFARMNALPMHMHVAEQRREIDECLAEHNVRPLELLDGLGALDARFCAVHATHLSDHEATLLGADKSFAAICRTTERDLGDGLVDVGRLIASGVRLCTGVDSHAISDPFEEARAIELDERSRCEKRNVALDAADMLAIATRNGYASLGIEPAAERDRVVLDDVAMTGIDDDAEAAIFGGSPRAVRDLVIDGRYVVENGHLSGYDAMREAYLAALHALTQR